MTRLRAAFVILLLGLALVFLLASCAQAPVGLPPIPATLPSLTGPVPVVWMDSLTDADGHPILGGYSPTHRTVYINRVVTDRRAQWLVARHEMCHHDMLAVGLHNIMDPKVAQAVCDWSALRDVRRMLGAP